MIQRGNSINKIRNYLIGKGIKDEFIKQTVDKINDENSDQDFFSAIKLCKKKLVQLESMIIENYFIRHSLLARNGLISRHLKKLWILKRRIFKDYKFTLIFFFLFYKMIYFIF